MTALARRAETLPEPNFTWRDGSGELHDPKSMETRHLYHVVAMIWNHTVPHEARISDYRRYRFPPFYTDRYMRRALRAMVPVLMSRDDIAPEWQAGIDHIKTWLLQPEFEEIRCLPSPT